MESRLALSNMRPEKETIEELIGSLVSHMVGAPELDESVRRLEAGVRILEQEIDTAISGVREQIRETRRHLGRLNLGTRGGDE